MTTPGLNIIFDMDGVIVESETHWHAVEGEFLKGIIPCWSWEDQQFILGMSARDVHRLLVERYAIAKTWEEFIGYYQGMSQSIYGERAELLPGVKTLLKNLAAESCTIGLASSSPHAWIRLVLDRYDLNKYFTAVVSADDVAGRGKPSPDIYLFAAKALGVSPESCIAIEDTSKGIQAAKAAGMRCVGFRNGTNSEQDFSLADIEFEGFENRSTEDFRGLGVEFPEPEPRH